MIRRFLGDYDKFECIADKCEATCCAGWAVEIDEESLEKYRNLDVEGVDYDDGCFKLQENNDCYYLNNKKLCNLYLKHGDGIFCRTCDMYPRHIEEFNGVREYSLSLSCPEASRLFLWGQTPEGGQTPCGGLAPVKVTESQDLEEETEEFEDFDDDIYAKLVKGRGFFFEILSDNKLSLSDKMKIILSSARKMQDEIDDGNISGCLEFIDGLKTEINNGEFNCKCYDLHDFEFYKNIFCELEPLNEEFSNFVRGIKTYTEEDKSEFYVNHNDADCYFTEIIRYFIFTYFCGSIYDEYYFGMAAVSVFFVEILMGIHIHEEKEKGSKLAKNELTKSVYMLSRELEHSTENMVLLEQLLDERL